MYGEVSKYRADLGVGVIRAADGRSYRFQAQDLVNPQGPLVGAEVDFEIDVRHPQAIILVSGSPWTVFGPKRD